MNKRMIFFVLFLSCLLSLQAQSQRERILLDDGWQFAFGNASSPASDFGCGTEYFNYLTKAASIHNAGPYSPKFDPKQWKAEWTAVDLPHDWAVDLPFAAEASHSHGYKTVGHQYPETSVGWYRKTIHIGEEDRGKHLWLQFDGIFRDARVWINGFYLGHEPSGYATQLYDISEYLNYGGDNLICVRADASLEEGWFYEGAGIYRHVWLNKSAPVHVKPFGIAVNTVTHAPYDKACVNVVVSIKNSGFEVAEGCEVRCRLIDADGRIIGEAMSRKLQPFKSQGERTTIVQIDMANPHLWSTDTPYLYNIETSIWQDDRVLDKVLTPFGIREIRFTANEGFLLNGKKVKLRGVNMHQDHAGIGVAIPDDMQIYRLRQLKKMGVNAYRSSHNPMTPEMLDACDRLGILVIEENRLTGINEEHTRLLLRMIDRDRNHPSIILWSVGNEEWGIEGNEMGERIAATMREYCHRYDPTRLMTVATSGGGEIVKPADVAGYNYILQNPVDDRRSRFPERIALGSEETSGCGTRGVYYRALAPEGTMPAINRSPSGRDSLLNAIERGWKFYDSRPWLCGLFYWTGFDYRGEPNPLKFPATGSQFGILDYCGFPKDEAYYLKAWWTDEPVLHLLPHWNLQGMEGQKVSVWAYSNCDAVELFVNGRSRGRQRVPRGGHLEWTAVYQPGQLKAVGYRNGKRVATEVVKTSKDASRIELEAEWADGASFAEAAGGRKRTAVVNVALVDKNGNFVPTADNELTLFAQGPVRILGVGNGNPAWQDAERPTDIERREFKVRCFGGRAQVLLQTTGVQGVVALKVSGEGLEEAVVITPGNK